MAQEKLYKSFFGLFYTIAKEYVYDKQEALETVNEAFLKIFVNIQTYDAEKAPFEAWSKRILQNVCIDAYRRIKRQPEIKDIDALSIENDYSQQEHNNLLNKEMETLFARLPNVTGRVCRMFLLDGYTHKEIAVMLGISEVTSRWHLGEGRKKLQIWLAHKRS